MVNAQGTASGAVWLWGSLLTGKALRAWVAFAAEATRKRVLVQRALQHWSLGALAQVLLPFLHGACYMLRDCAILALNKKDLS